MKSKLPVLVLVVVLTVLAATPIAAALMASPCTAGASYNPACDANQDDTVNVLDIQLTAGHWNQSGTWVSDNNHVLLSFQWTATIDSSPVTVPHDGSTAQVDVSSVSMRPTITPTPTPRALSLPPTPTPTPTPTPGTTCYLYDVHPDASHIPPALCDGDVDIADVERVAGCWGQQVGPVGSACPVTLDFDGSGLIDGLDLVAVTGAWGWPNF